MQEEVGTGPHGEITAEITFNVRQAHANEQTKIEQVNCGDDGDDHDVQNNVMKKYVTNLNPCECPCRSPSVCHTMFYNT